ncbi:hypothetical protein [Rufibacter quisquiliarum]|uniref:Uncharacterized protein n=1 Tax=Rufibacter quisquiliarum TaxID=1549639 RepID=A0A839GYH6_9BACT|nr:hypothetical protein [Rufibacter quisquiliarum]MBA9079877.1 hypothetical protein [Rufibacter quisquiliarum]
MFHIVIHCQPKKENEEFFGKVIGAYASVLLDFKDYDGAMVLSKHYVEENGWEIIEIDDEYFTFDTKEDLPDDYQQYFHELGEYGYSIIFNSYEKEE